MVQDWTAVQEFGQLCQKLLQHQHVSVVITSCLDIPLNGAGRVHVERLQRGKSVELVHDLASLSDAEWDADLAWRLAASCCDNSLCLALATALVTAGRCTLKVNLP